MGVAVRDVKVQNSIEVVSLNDQPAGLYMINISNDEGLIGRDPVEVVAPADGRVQRDRNAQRIGVFASQEELVSQRGVIDGALLDGGGVQEAIPMIGHTGTRVRHTAWSVDGFTILSRGGGLMDITSSIAVLLVMGAVLFALAAYLFDRRGIGPA